MKEGKEGGKKKKKNGIVGFNGLVTQKGKGCTQREAKGGATGIDKGIQIVHWGVKRGGKTKKGSRKKKK